MFNLKISKIKIVKGHEGIFAMFSNYPNLINPLFKHKRNTLRSFKSRPKRIGWDLLFIIHRGRTDLWFVHKVHMIVDIHCKYFRIFIHFIFVFLGISSLRKPAVQLNCDLEPDTLFLQNLYLDYFFFRNWTGTIRYKFGKNRGCTVSTSRIHIKIYAMFPSRNDGPLRSIWNVQRF